MYMTYLLVYVGTANNPADAEILNGVINKIAERNKKQDISGFLFYKDGTYLQLLEGEFEKVNALFYKIVKDPRHKNVTVLLENKIDHAIFNDYESGFLVPKDKNQYQKLNNYLNYLKLLENNEIDCTISILGSVISKM